LGLERCDPCFAFSERASAMLLEPGPARLDEEPMSPDNVVTEDAEWWARSPNKPFRGRKTGVPGVDGGGDGRGVLFGVLGVLGVLGLLSYSLFGKPPLYSLNIDDKIPLLYLLGRGTYSRSAAVGVV
jgi:hypothetical protein